MLSLSSWDKLKNRLSGTLAARYLTASNKATASSILSVLATSTQPLNLLFESEKKFSLTEYFAEVQQGSSAWLFLSTKPDMRNVTMPIIACLFELAISYLIGIGINEKRRMWFIIDELASLGNLPGFPTLISESRKYGGCIFSATQSINQIFDNFGMLQGSTIFGQFATKFLFRSDEPATAKIITEIFGQLEYATSQKNTSYGAHEFRDGISYTEGTKRKALITTNDLATLADLECFVSLPEPKARIARIKVPIATNVPIKHPGFVAASRATNNNSIRPPSKLAYAEGFEGDTSPRTAAYSSVREDSSTGSTYKSPAEVEFRRRSIINYHVQEASVPDISNEQASQTDSDKVMSQMPQDHQKNHPWWQEARQEYAAITNNNKMFKDKQ